LSGPEQEIIDAINELLKHGLLYGRGGNMSVRGDNGTFVITPSQKDYSQLTVDDFVTLDMEGNIIKGEKNPSVEVPLHLEIYKRRRDVQSVFHTHSTYVSVLAVTHSPLPVLIDEMTVRLGGEVEVCKYAMTGTEDLAKSVADSLGKKNAVLMANHGCVTVGKSVAEALENAVLLENAAKVYVLSRIFGTPVPLPEETLSIEKELFESLQGLP
jgi:L-ribulose-5-phosphate 4-epimerase